MVKLYRLCKGSVAEVDELSQCHEELPGDGTQRTQKFRLIPVGKQPGSNR